MSYGNDGQDNQQRDEGGWGGRSHDHGQQRQGGGGYQGGNQNRSNYGGGNGGGGYQQRQGGGGGGYPQRQGGGGGGFNKGGGQFQRKEEPPSDAFYLPYAVTGNDNPPPHVMNSMSNFIKELDGMGYTFRCGGMKGFESDIEQASGVERKEIHLPWKGFDNKDSKFTYTPENAKLIAARFQPGYEGLKGFIQTFLAKNVRLLTGKDLKSNALFLIVWSEDGAETGRERSPRTGNCGHAIAVADAMHIPVFNFGKPDAEKRLRAFLDQRKPREQANTVAPDEY